MSQLSINDRNDINQSALVLAAKRNRDYMVQRLLDEGADYSEVRGEEFAILSDLTQNNMLGSLKKMIGMGANPHNFDS